MNKIIHLGTTMQTTIGIMDDEGNVLNTATVDVTVTKLSGAGFQEALRLIEDKKTEWKAQLEDATKGLSSENNKPSEAETSVGAPSV